MTEQRHAGLAIHGAPDTGDDHHEQLKRRQIARRMRLISVAVLVLLGLGAARTLVARAANAKALQDGVTEHSAIYVKTTQPQSSGNGQTVALPAALAGIAWMLFITGTTLSVPGRATDWPLPEDFGSVVLT